jgi:hypothetical protein
MKHNQCKCYRILWGLSKRWLNDMYPSHFVNIHRDSEFEGSFQRFTFVSNEEVSYSDGTFIHQDMVCVICDCCTVEMKQVIGSVSKL